MNEEEIKNIRNMDVKSEDWDTSMFPYMTNEQLIDIHYYMYNKLLKFVKQLRGGLSIGDIGVPMIVKRLVNETTKRIKGYNDDL